MTTIVVMCEEKLYADGIFSCLLCASLPDTLNLIHLPLSRRLSLSVDYEKVDIIIYNPHGFDKNAVTFFQKIRRHNPSVCLLNIISDLDNVVRTDPNIEYMHRNNSFDVMKEIIVSFMARKPHSVAIEPTAKRITKRSRTADAVKENLERLYQLDALFLSGDKMGYCALFREILDVAFNHASLDPDALPMIRKHVSSYLYTFFYRNCFDVIFSNADFLTPLNNPNVTEKQIIRIFMKMSELISSSSIKGNESAAVLKAKAYIRKNLFKDLTLTAVAEELSLNPSYLSRVFSKEVGEPMGEYIAKLKLDSAKAYLLKGKMSVNDISLKLGFRSVNYFIRFFKKHTGLPPSAWREKVASR